MGAALTAADDDVPDPRPVAPREPERWECCQSGCDPCVYDRYWDALSRYETALGEWEQRQKNITSGAP